MMRILALLTTLSLISTAYVQVRDDFNGGFSQQWRWTLPQNDPFCTLFDNAVSFTSNSMIIQTRDGAMFQAFNSHKNVPTLRVGPNLPEEWYIETVFRTDWSTVPFYYYTQAGIVITTGARNYFQVLITRNATDQTDTINGSTNSEIDDNFAWGERVTNPWTPDTDWVGVRIERVGGEDPHIVVKFRNSATGGWVEYDGFNGGRYYPGSGFYEHIMNLLSQGARIGVYTDNACGCGLVQPFEFDYFETNLPVLPVGDVNSDNLVDDADLLAVLFAFGSSGDCLDEDVNGDGTVDDADLLAVLFNFGSGG
ncbi:MAG: hypothetical protein N2045_02190 [Fimbriimonadales bacterium]|jgi:hypothetical protein|nr:hypothetical protein [Fimbriimonadales bacterium]GBC90009.1 hypothetical protein HRbin14_00741 [bacterium HR14]GIV13471.1 MAG: hypothetical protein KatS3mg021_1753 [Fimbriimonadales bacterium]CUU05761.1 hypothetical protein GBSOP10_10441 [Armatimonadetes bacterium GBS]CUU36138.1 hypothetical protein GXSOP10_122159 [Armatimonadetes bacterium GXS]